MFSAFFHWINLLISFGFLLVHCTAARLLREVIWKLANSSSCFSEQHCLSNLLHTAAATSLKCRKSTLSSVPLFMMIPFVRHAVREVFFGVHPAGWQNWSELKKRKRRLEQSSNHNVASQTWTRHKLSHVQSAVHVAFNKLNVHHAETSRKWDSFIHSKHMYVLDWVASRQTKLR